ncbi:hypothetical protein D7V77_15035 [Corallococcus sp. CA041A]|uniref:hypothetical protein n=1 Tax=Corallococcus sp. CA041A TaxID=2316727 RepID=UPI000EA26491|nr:hypothetical protein [Corallococcus sp. CA041A]RKH26278.1 hypothetical protein D7V77_15035 [Corallococcus sp. CA041A]
MPLPFPTPSRWLLPGLLLLGFAPQAVAMPTGPGTFCAEYPNAPACQGTQPACTYCHVAPPQRNGYGAALEPHLAPGKPRPLSDADFAAALPAALRAIASEDADGDGAPNQFEVEQGSLPGDATSVPPSGVCGGGENPQFKVCQYDPRFAYRRMLSDFCGTSPTYAQVVSFLELGNEEKQRAFIDQELDRCLQSDFWRGKHGQLWKVAHPKIRPVGSIKSGEDAGIIPLADYYDDYALFTWSQTDDHDARDVLTASFYVKRSGSSPTTYTTANSLSSQFVEASRRAGNMTSAWTLTSFVMFTALPRNAASQMYRAYLGLDIAKQEGLHSVPNEPRDYDAKGVQAPQCAACHATLDPLSYPYRNYNGLGGLPNRYIPNRLELLFPNEAATLKNTPEQGVILGQPVNNLMEWAGVAANSDAFAISTVTDYWKLLVGHAPLPEENEEFVRTWQAFRTTHAYRVQKMLHDLIRTEAYGAP